jgi:hypothetical protein
LFLLTNVSKSQDLTSIIGFPFRGVHVEFYDKTCTRANIEVFLSAGDVDQINIKALGTQTANGQGWADIDVRAGTAQTDEDSLQCNVLLGEVVTADSAGDFAVAYPMASSIGSSNKRGGLIDCDSTIVHHDSNGSATDWHGRYEPFPSRVFVPFFFAEGGPLGMKSQLVLAAPADGNWYDADAAGGNCNPGGATGVCANGESPGQDLGRGDLMAGTAIFFDGCENQESRPFGGHWINSPLSDITLLGAKADQGWPWTADVLCKIGAPAAGGTFPHVDGDYQGAFVGWVDLPNTLPDSSAKLHGASGGDFWNGPNKYPRGMVGVLIQNTTIGKKEGDAVRLWGDPSDGGRGDREPYSSVDEVDHSDLR